MSEGAGEFNIRGLIGQGAFGKVFLLENDNHKKLALKVIELLGRHPKEIQQTIQEVKLLAEMDHENILKYVQASQEGSKLMIMTEYCPNGDLKEYIERHTGEVMPEARLVEWIRQITSSLKYLHNLEKPVIHRDLKTANIFLDEKWNCKLGDFGIARVLQTSTDWATTQCGTPMYMSPEVFNGIPYSDKTDIFSLGIMMYEMAHMDKEAIQPQMILFRICHMQLPTMPTGYSSNVTDLMAMMMKNDPNDRPSATEVLAHATFKNARKPPAITDRPKHEVLDDVPEEDEDDETLMTLMGTLTQLRTGMGRPAHGGGAAMYMGNAGTTDDDGQVDEGSVLGDFSGNPVMTLVHRTLVGMGKTGLIRGDTLLEKQANMLKIYCLNCLDNNDSVFQKACRALDSSHNEDEIEEVLIRVLGPEKYGLCGVQLLHYKNYTFNLRK